MGRYIKVIDRQFLLPDKDNYKPCWYLSLECGHTKILGSTSPGYARGGIVQNTLCPICDTPKKKKPVDARKLQRFADWIIENDL